MSEICDTPIMNTVLIVGASSGIGYACAKKYLHEGHSVLALSRTECVLAGVKNFLCDVSDEPKLDQTLTEIIQNDDVDRLIYCAGFSMASPIEHIRREDYRYLFDVNFFGFVHCLNRLLPSLRHTSGTACIVSSLAALLPIPFDGYYSASKAALNALCTALQTELRPKGVQVISVMPGGTKTNFTFKRKVYKKEEVGDYFKAQTLSVKKLSETEQSGQEASKVADLIYEKCDRKDPSHLFISGLKNKFFGSISKLLPQPVLTFLTKSFYFSEEG